MPPYRSFGSSGNWSAGIDHLHGSGGGSRGWSHSVQGGVERKLNNSWSASAHMGHTHRAGMNYGVGLTYKFGTRS